MRGLVGLPVIVLRRVVRRIAKELGGFSGRRRDRIRSTYLPINETKAPVRSFLAGIRSVPPNAIAATASRYFCEHRFDLLGSGWTRVKHGMRCRGLEGVVFPSAQAVSPDSDGAWLRDRVTPGNLSESQRIWRLVGSRYTPIDWQLDFKSGYRWSELTWFRDIRFGNVRAADVKVPWELSRLQHLPQLAVEFGSVRSPSLVAEIRNQMLDWIATNPPRFGVNWVSTMDVAIRVANMLVAYDLALSYGAKFDPEFVGVFRRSVMEHARHVVENLEWSADFRGNHYLSNIAGLLFAAAYLGDDVEMRELWIEFATEELVTAVEEQFHADGANFEASTNYHRLSAEMVVYATALAQRVQSTGKSALPDWYFERLERMGRFASWYSDADGRAVQIGDNDSGRFFKLQPKREMLTCATAKGRYSSLDGFNELESGDTYPDEQHLDHRHLLSGISALIDRDDWVIANENDFERSFVAALTASSVRPPRVTGRSSSPRSGGAAAPGRQADATFHLEVGDAFAAADLCAFPDFGVYILKSERAHMCIRSGQLGQNGVGGHAHNDQLSFTFRVGSRDWIVDPGTYLYTPFPDRRNEYRSAAAHNGPRPASGEPGYFGAGLFRIVDPWVGECLHFSADTFIGVMHRRSSRITRQITLRESMLIVKDWATGCDLFPQDHDAVFGSRLAFSPGYGILERVVVSR